MKKLVAVFVLILFTSMTFGQIQIVEDIRKEEVGRVTPEVGFEGSVICYKISNDGVVSYDFVYNNSENEDRKKEEKFTINSQEEFDTFYSYILKGFKEMKGNDIDMKINISNGSILLLQFRKTNKNETVSITHINNGKETKATESSVRDIRRLFGN